MRKIFTLLIVAILATATSWAAEKTEGFETKAAETNYKGTVVVTADQSDCSVGWKIYYGCVSTTDKISGKNSAALRLYTEDKYGYIQTTTAIEGLSNVSFKAKAATTKSASILVDVYYSTNGTNWVAIKEGATYTTSATEYSYKIPKGGQYIKIAISKNSIKPTEKNAQLTIDDVVFTSTADAKTYTYTWSVNGEKTQNILNEGDKVEAPKPASIGGKEFTGWVTTSTVDANKKPEYAKVDATAIADRTYYAVFATKTEDGGEKWVKTPASKITEEGVYALITKDGNAFNGEIKSGHGQSTATTFMFDKNNEATSAPDGTCELTFVKKGEGYSIYRDGTEKYKYLYSEASKSGSLKWAVAEQNYWYYDKTKGSWAYKVKDTETAYLNVYNTNNTFRTYYQAGSTSPVYFAQKVAGAGYADFTTIVKAAEVITLANLAVNGAEGTAYQVNDVMVVAKKFQKGDKNYIVVKDAAQAVRNVSAPTDDDKFFNINGNKQEEYTQNNWMLVSLPVELYNQLNEKSTVTSITGSLTEKFNVAMEATKVVFENATNNFAPNTYCPINFMGESSVKGTNPAYTSSYYFATPKANEYAKVVWAVYNGGAFYLPSNNGSINVQEFKAAFNVDYSLNSVDNPKLTSGNVYSFEALVKEVAVPTTDAKSAPRKTAYDSTVAPSTKFVVYPLDLDANKVATGVNDVNSAKEVKGVSYFNMMGVESAQPFDGVNIMVTTYTDGTQSAAKVLR